MIYLHVSISSVVSYFPQFSMSNELDFVIFGKDMNFEVKGYSLSFIWFSINFPAYSLKLVYSELSITT